MVEEAIARIRSLGRLVEFLIIFRSNIDTFEACPMMPHMDVKKLKIIYDKV